MKTIIAGSRTCTNLNQLNEAIKICGWTPTVVISGCARGADRLGEIWARRNNIPIKQFPAQWNLYGRAAGYRRNEEMADQAEALIALWDGSSKGTRHMIDLAARKKLQVFVYRTQPNAPSWNAQSSQ